MKFCLITFRSVTPAQRGEGILRRAGFVCSLQRTPRWMEEQGCGYSLRIRCQDAEEAVQLLRKHTVQFRKLYLSKDNGTVEDMTL